MYIKYSTKQNGTSHTPKKNFDVSLRSKRGFTPTPILTNVYLSASAYWKNLAFRIKHTKNERIGVSFRSKRGFTHTPTVPKPYRRFAHAGKPSARLACGFGLVEVLFGIAILGTSFLVLFGVFASLTKATINNTDELSATFLLEEGIEAVRYVRATDWSTTLGAYSLDTPYWLLWSGGMWTLTTTEQPFIDDRFERTITFSAVNRDGSDDIAPSGTIDTDTKYVSVSVAWYADGATTTRSLGAYIANIYE